METKVIKVNPKELKLLEVNARFMKADEFKRLVNSVKRDGCLTQLPFCCYNDKKELVVLSGNHRVKASIEAGLKEIEVQITEEKLSKDQRIAIQLSHNAISGQDDMAILKDLYESIDDINYKDYSGLDDQTLKLLDDITAKDGRVINKALEKLTSKGLIKSKEKDKGLAYLSEYYLENEKKKKEQSK